MKPKPQKTKIGLAPNNNFSASLLLRSGLTTPDIAVNVVVVVNIVKVAVLINIFKIIVIDCFTLNIKSLSSKL